MPILNRIPCQILTGFCIIRAKSYRDVLNKIDSSTHGAFAVLQGKLAGAREILEAGFTVQPIVPKEITQSG